VLREDKVLKDSGDHKVRREVKGLKEDKVLKDSGDHKELKET
jgi:hypothetical protein